MGGEINEPTRSGQDDSNQRPSSFDDLFSAPAGDSSSGRISPSGDSNPGKLNPGGDNAQDRLNRTASVRDTENAALSGDAAKLEKSLQNAFERMGGDPNKFQKFGKELAEQLKDDGVTVKAGKNSIAFHKDGSPDGVEFKMDGNLDPSTGKVVADAKAQSYDWVTKQDTTKKSEDVIKQLGQKDANGTGAKIRDAQELGKGFDESFANGDFTQYNKDIAASFAHAYKVGGMEAVKKLELQANDPEKGGAKTPGAGPVAIEQDGKLKIYNADAVSKDVKALAQNMTPEQLSKSGIIKHPDFGYLRIKDQGPPPIELKSLAGARN